VRKHDHNSRGAYPRSPVREALVRWLASLDAVSRTLFPEQES